MEEFTGEGMYRVLPQIDDDIRDFVLHDDAGPVVQFGQVLSEMGLGLERVDEEMEGMSLSNPNLAAIVHGTVEGLYSAFSQQIPTEQGKASLRAIAHINAFVVLRALDLQTRRNEAK